MRWRLEQTAPDRMVCVENSERRGKNWPVESVELRWKSEVTQLN